MSYQQMQQPTPSSSYSPQSVPQQHLDSLKNDSLEYFIKFPTPNLTNGAGDKSSVAAPTAPTTESDFVFVYNETNVPIVMLLGWAGCQDKYLMKYSKIYEDRGLITVRYTAPVENLFWKRQAMKSIGEKILKLIYDMNFDSHPIFFHVFSNGGAFLYQHIALALRRSHRPIQIRGMIFDSAPGERRYMGLYRAISAIYGHEKRFNMLFSMLLSVSLLFIWLIDDTICSIRNVFYDGDPIQSNPVAALRDEPSNWPQLFLYSKEDLLIPDYDILQFAEYRRKRGIDTQIVCFEDSPHVKHFIRHPHLYVHCVCKFIKDCMSYTSYRNQEKGSKIN